MKKTEEIFIWWEGSFKHEQIIKNTISKKNYYNKATDIGLYTVYGQHPLYGKNVLLYIGITTEQDFKTRLMNRWIIDDSSDIKNIRIYLGKIYNPNKVVPKEIEIKNIKQAEALLINILKPAFNSAYINSVNYKNLMYANDFNVYNMNSYNSLPAEISTARWWNQKELNFEITNKFAKDLNKKIEDNEEIYGFNLDNDNIFLGVDYNYWDKTNIPLVIGVYKKSIPKKVLKEEISDFGEDKNYYFITACENLKDDKVQEQIQILLYKIIKLLEKHA